MFRDWLGTRPGCIEEPSSTKLDEQENKPTRVVKKRSSLFDYPLNLERLTEEVSLYQDVRGPVVETMDTLEPILTYSLLEETFSQEP